MIVGFEKETKNLSNEEIQLARYAWQAMKEAFDCGESINNAGIAEFVKSKTGICPAGSRVRKMINWMHIKGYIPGLIADSKGYHRAKNEKELMDYAESLRGRIDAIRGRLEATTKDILKYRQTSLK